MILSICAIRDRATDSFNNPIFVTHVGQAVRAFTDEINRDAENSSMFRHPDDFDLYVFGTFDTDSGLFNTDVPRQIAVGKDVKIRS